MFINVVNYVISDFNGVMAVLIRQSIQACWRNISHAVGGGNKPPLSTHLLVREGGSKLVTEDQLIHSQ